MTFRKTLTVIVATLVTSAAFASAADAATSRRAMHHNRHHAARHMSRTPASMAAQRDGGSAQVDSLNQRSLDAARGGAAQ